MGVIVAVPGYQPLTDELVGELAEALRVVEGVEVGDGEVAALRTALVKAWTDGDLASVAGALEAALRFASDGPAGELSASEVLQENRSWLWTEQVMRPGTAYLAWTLDVIKRSR
jgi:hypothetical protein